MSTPSGDGLYERIADSFGRQTFMAHLGAHLVAVRPGEVEIALTAKDTLKQQHGFLHAGVVTSIVDSACGYAALTTMSPGAGVLSVEFKVNLVAPASGARFLAKGQVLKAGRTLVVCRGDVWCVDGEAPRLIAAMQATMMVIQDRPGISDEPAR